MPTWETEKMGCFGLPQAPKGPLMAYSEAAKQRRRCTGTRKDGQPCQAWALWDDPRQLCMAHAGRHHTGPMAPLAPWWTRDNRTRYQPCTCMAYAWPHRPGGGLCRWPHPPLSYRTTPAGTHSDPRPRNDLHRTLLRHWRQRAADEARRRQADDADGRKRW